MNEYNWTPSATQANYDGVEPNFTLYGFGYQNNNYYRKAEDFGCTIEKTDTGLRVTINELFKRQDGSLYPFYGIDYWLVPKNLEALKKIEEMARANGEAGGEEKYTLVNTVSSRGTSANATAKIGIINDFMPIDKTSETYVDLVNPYNNETRVKLDDVQVGNETVRDTPDGITPENIVRYVMKYRVVLNKGKERLNEGNNIIVEDEYSSNLSVDFTSIKITTDPVSAASGVSYDYSGNVGYFTIPDETMVVIEYEAVILNNAAGMVDVSNEVRMLQYKKKLDDKVDHNGSGGSSALNPSILLKKYGSGHMEKGLNGAVFRLYEYKNPTYTRGDSNRENDWDPVELTLPSPRYADFTTHNLSVGDKYYGDGYAEIELSQNNDGITLLQNKVYGLREIVQPTGTATNGDIINYQNPHRDDFYCYVFSICGNNETADYTNFVYMPDDTMTVRNTPESITLHMKKQISGNCTLSSTETQNLTYQIFRKKTVGENDLYMPVMKTVTDPDRGTDTEIIDERFRNITYSDIAANDGVDVTGLTVKEGASVGEYLLVEYGNDNILSSHPDWSWRGTYAWSDGAEGSFTNAAYTVYDSDGLNPQTVTGVAFNVTSQEIKDGDDKTVTLTNSYNREEVDLTANKRWTDPSGATTSWPSGRKVTFQIGTLDPAGTFTAVPGVSNIELDNISDSNGEEVAGSAVFRNLPKYEADGSTLVPIQYAVRETAAVTGYDIVYPVFGTDYAAFGVGTSVTIKNRVVATSVRVSKSWNGVIPAGASAVFRLYSYTGSDPSSAEWVSNVNDITLDGIPDGVTFGEITAWQADFTGLPQYDTNGLLLNYIVKEISSMPTGYVPAEAYAADGGTITNILASVTFTVTKRWSGTPNNTWPSGEKITLRLARKTRSGIIDDTFMPCYVLTENAVVQQDSIYDPYGFENQTAGSCSGGTLTVTDLPEYDGNGNEWLYYVTETAVQSVSDDSDLTGSYSVTYRDKNNYTVSDMTYSGGSLTNTRSSKNLTVSKTVAGNMGNTDDNFRFTVTLQNGGTNFSGNVSYSKTLQNSTVTDGTLEFVNGSAGITLRHNESVEFKDLSSGLSYTVTENAEDAMGYQTEYSIDGGSALSGRSAAGTIDDDIVVSFRNTKQVTIPTGVDFPIIIFAVIGIPMLFLFVILMRRRKE